LKANLVRRLLEAATSEDKAALRKTALQIAAAESAAGHTRVAEQIRSIVDRISVPSGKSPARTIDIAAPRGELSDLLIGGFRRERLSDIVLSESTLHSLQRLLSENRRRAELESHGLNPSRHLLFFGPPGCGKTLAARVTAGELGIPLFTVRFDALFSRFLGATGGHLKTIFDEMPRHPGVYFFDEFDAVGKLRNDSQDVGEAKRVVTAFLQMMDSDEGPSVVIAATNHEKLIDPALIRRFDEILQFEMPSLPEILKVMKLRFQAYRLPDSFFKGPLEAAEGLSFADVVRAASSALRSMILEKRKRPSSEDLRKAIEQARRRSLT